ncbi:hypothetical protein [Comamonas sp. F1-6]|uniref:hypothetical protein n=1 Tax=Comamonas sp. F1-6 TaxID=673550 RepID=UPI0031D0730D
MQEQYRKAHEAIKNGAKAHMAVALHTVIIGLGVRKLAVSDGLADLTGNELLSSRGRALVNREQELHIAQKVLCELLVKECRGLGRQQQCMSATQAAPAPVTVPTMEQKIAGAHAADIKPSQAEAVYLAMLATTPAAVPAAVAVPAEVTALLEALESMVDVCEGHDFDGAPSDAHMEKARAAISAYLAMLAATPAAAAPAAVAVPDGGTPGLWSVRKREVDGELRDCFVTAPDCQGLPYDAEIMGDDEYRDDNGIARKLADCELIVTAVNAYRAALAATQAAGAPAAVAVLYGRAAFTQDDVIRLAKEANAPADACVMLSFLGDFAAKVISRAISTCSSSLPDRDAITRLAKEADAPDLAFQILPFLERFAAKVLEDLTGGQTEQTAIKKRTGKPT